MGVIDMALWDLAGQVSGLPVYKLLGGCRDKVKAYASTYPNMGTLQNYAEHALACKDRGLPGIQDSPVLLLESGNGRSRHRGARRTSPRTSRSCTPCATRSGDDMVLSFDPWGTYRTYEEAYRVGRELRALELLLVRAPHAGIAGGGLREAGAELDDPDPVAGDRRRAASSPAPTGFAAARRT